MGGSIRLWVDQEPISWDCDMGSAWSSMQKGFRAYGWMERTVDLGERPEGRGRGRGVVDWGPNQTRLCHFWILAPPSLFLAYLPGSHLPTYAPSLRFWEIVSCIHTLPQDAGFGPTTLFNGLNPLDEVPDTIVGLH